MSTYRCYTLLFPILKLVVLTCEEHLEVLIGAQNIVLGQVVQEPLDALHSLADELGIVLQEL